MTPYSNEYTLKNGRKLIVRQPVAADAEGLIALIQRVDTESRFLGREPGEFDFTPDGERELIEGMLTAERERWFVAEYEALGTGRKLDMGKSCIRFRKPEHVPVELIGRLAEKVTPEQWIAFYEKSRAQGRPGTGVREPRKK